MTVVLLPLSEADRLLVQQLDLETAQGVFLPSVSAPVSSTQAWGLWKGSQLIGVVEVVGTGPVLWIARIGVDRAYQGLGYGQWTLEQVLLHLGRRLRVQELRAAVHKENYAAHRLFQKAGFQPVGEADPVGEMVYVYRFR